MSSNINITNIDATFPVAGKDNSSQGFRDNFSAIKLAFSTATTEISNLQLGSVQVNQSNDFQFNGSLVRAKIQNSGFVANNNATATGELDYSQGNYKRISISTATTTATFYVTNWPPSGIYAEMRLELRPDAPYPGGDWPGIQIDITQPGGVVYTSNKPNAQYQSTLPHTMFGVQAPDSSYGMFPTMITLWTTDGGITVFADVDTVNVMGSLYGTGYYPKNTYTVV